MADYIYTLESRLTPDQMRGVTLIQDLSRAAGLNVYLTGGAVRDILTGFPIRDLDFTLQGSPLKLQKELEKAGAVIHGTDDHTNTLLPQPPGQRARRTQHGAQRAAPQNRKASSHYPGHYHGRPSPPRLHHQTPWRFR